MASNASDPAANDGAGVVRFLGGHEQAGLSRTGSNLQPKSARRADAGTGLNPTWTVTVGGNYGPSRLLANANGVEPRVMMRVGPKGVEIWVGAAPWCSGDRRREFPGATLASHPARAYVDTLIRFICDTAVAQLAERERNAELREGWRR